MKKFVKKILFQDKILKILIGLIVAFPPILLTLYGIFYDSSAMDLQLVLFMFSVVYLIFFMFISYEYIYKLKSNRLIECINTTPKGTKSIVKNKILLLCAIAFVETFMLIVINTVFVIYEGTLTAQYFIYIILSIILNIFLLCVAGIFIGTFAALKLKRISSYLLMVFAAIMTSRILDILWIGLYSETGMNIFKITGLFQLTAPSTNWVPNTAFGFSLLPYRFAIVLFWTIFPALGIILSFHQIDKKKAKATACALLAAICLVVYFIPSSKVIMDQRNIDGPSADYEYYNKYKTEIMTENGNFSITDLTMELSTNFLLKATAVIQVDNKNLDKYKFTLYHGYTIKNVKINGEDVAFDRHLDYFEIDNKSKADVETITVNYYGYSSKYYSNLQGTILPGFLPYYPMAGYQEVYDLDYQSFVPNRSNESINFDVKISSLNQFYSNLNEENRNHFTGSSKSLTLVSGFYKASTIEGIKIVYPYPDSIEMADDVIENYTKKFKNSNVDNGKTKTIIIFPSVNQGQLETVYNGDDYIVSKWIVDIQDDYTESLIDKDKRDLYYCIDEFVNNNEYYQETKEYFDFAALFEKNLEQYGETAFYEKCNQYLFDSSDHRTIDEFLADLQENNEYA